MPKKVLTPRDLSGGDSEKLTEANEKSLSLTADAARETDSAVQEVAAERADISNARSYNVSKVHSDTLDTAELIAKLYASPKVISAEPNYIFNAAEAYALEGDEQTDNPCDDAGKEKADDQAGKVPDANLNVKSGLSSTGQHDPDVGDLSSAQWYLKDGSTINTLEGIGDGDVSLDVPGYSGGGTGRENSSPDSTIAIFDSGMDVNHPDLAGRFYTFSSEQQARYGCGEHGLNATADPDGEDVGDLTDPVDHGTHCSGIMVANWDGKGVAGVSASDKMT